MNPIKRVNSLDHRDDCGIVSRAGRRPPKRSPRAMLRLCRLLPSSFWGVRARTAWDPSSGT